MNLVKLEAFRYIPAFNKTPLTDAIQDAAKIHIDRQINTPAQLHYTVGGEINLNPRMATAETPIHEYAHLWSAFMGKVNPKGWGDIVKLMKGCKNLWDQVARDYPELKTENDIAEEVLTHYSGQRGAERLRAEMQRTMESAGKDVRAR